MDDANVPSLLSMPYLGFCNEEDSIYQNTDAGTYMMHEGVYAEDAAQYTREWFSWANAMFSELVLSYCGYEVK